MNIFTCRAGVSSGWRGAFQELATEQAEADGGAERAQAEDQADAESSEALDLGDVCEIFHCSSERID
jgi:hypothetical protein